MLLRPEVDVGAAKPVEHTKRTPKPTPEGSIAQLASEHVPLAERQTVIALTPESAKQLMREFSEANSNIDEKAKFCRTVIAELCKAGYSEDAWDLIDDSYGKIRTTQISTFFGHAALSAENLIHKMSTLDPKSDLRAAFNGFSLRHSVDEMEEILASNSLSSLMEDGGGREMSGALSGTLQLALHKASADDIDGVLRAAEQWHTRGWLETPGLMALLENEKIGDPFQKWDVIKSIENEAQWHGETKSQKDTLIGKMVTANAPNALNQILAQDSILASDDVYRAVSYWSALDSGGLATWYASNHSNFSKQQIDSLASALSKVALGSHEYQSAKLWAERIQDLNLRERQLQAVEEGAAN